MSEAKVRDWTAVRRRLEAVEKVLRAGTEPTREELERIYRQRAEELARPLPQAGDIAAGNILVFRTGAARFGVPLNGVAEVIARPKIARVPGAPPEIAGLVQARGEVRQVWNLQAVFAGQTPGGKTEETGSSGIGQILLLRHAGQEAGVLAQIIEDIMPYDPEKLRPSDQLPGTHLTDDYVTVIDIKTLFERLQNSTPL